MINFIFYINGEEYLKNFLHPCIQSIFDIYNKNCKIYVAYSNCNPYILKDISNIHLFSVNNNNKNPAAKINSGWLPVLGKIKNNENIAFLDADTILIKDISHFFENDFDIAYTYYSNHNTPYGDQTFTKSGYNRINTGVILGKNNKRLKEFFNNYSKTVLNFFKNGSPLRNEFMSIDQDALMWELIAQNPNNLQNFQHTSRYISDALVHPFTCAELNDPESRPVNDETHIIHYKGAWRKIIPDGDWEFASRVCNAARKKENSLEQYLIWKEKYDKWNQ